MKSAEGINRDFQKNITYLSRNKEICTLLLQEKSRGMDMLFHTYYKALVLWADTFLNHLARAEDVVQEFFIHIWEKGVYKELKPETLSSFLFTAVRNRCLNLLDKKEIFNHLTDIQDVLLQFEEYNEHRDEMEMQILGKIEHLSPRSREIIHAVFVEGKKYREVAGELKISESSVKTVVHRSIRQLRGKIDSFVLFFSFCKKNYFSCQLF